MSCSMTTKNPKSDLQLLILKQIEQQDLSFDQIVKLMGYQSAKSQTKAIERLQYVLSIPDLGILPSCANNHYDLKYASVEFIQALCHVLDIPRSVYQPVLTDLERQAYQNLNAKMPTVYADISFNDNYQPSFMNVMAMSKFTHAKLDDAIRLLEHDKQVKAIHTSIKQHQSNMAGHIPFDGVINGYRVTLYGIDSDNQASLYIPASTV